MTPASPSWAPTANQKQEAGQPIRFIQGMGRVIPGWDLGFDGMKIGGKRRLFIPWQLAYGAKGRPGPDAAHPGVPPKADLIFDVELLAVTEMPAMPNRPPMGAMPGGRPMPWNATALPAVLPTHRASPRPQQPLGLPLRQPRPMPHRPLLLVALLQRLRQIHLQHRLRRRPQHPQLRLSRSTPAPSRSRSDPRCSLRGSDRSLHECSGAPGPDSRSWD
jgi:hypothetical protein